MFNHYEQRATGRYARSRRWTEPDGGQRIRVRQCDAARVGPPTGSTGGRIIEPGDEDDLWQALDAIRSP